MPLPDLPKRRKQKETKVTPKVLKWFRENYSGNAAIEIKVDNNFLLSHQKKALRKVADGQFTYKLADYGARMPFDAVILNDADPLVVHVSEYGNCTAYNIKTNEEFTFKI